MNSKTGYRDIGGLEVSNTPANKYFEKYSFSFFEVGISIGIVFGGFNTVKNRN